MSNLSNYLAGLGHLLRCGLIRGCQKPLVYQSHVRIDTLLKNSMLTITPSAPAQRGLKEGASAMPFAKSLYFKDVGGPVHNIHLRRLIYTTQLSFLICPVHGMRSIRLAIGGCIRAFKNEGC